MLLVDQEVYESYNGSLSQIMNYLDNNTDFNLYLD